MQKMGKNKQVECALCGKSMRSDHVGRHMKSCEAKMLKTQSTVEATNNSREEFSCTWPYCLRAFRDNYNLSRHVLSHTAERITCDKCGRAIQRKDNHKHACNGV